MKYNSHFTKRKVKLDTLRNKSITIVLHEGTHGPGHDLRDFVLKRRVKKLLFVTHPLLFFPENAKKPSRYELYEKGRLIRTENAFLWKLPEPVLYMKDFLYSLAWTIRFNSSTHIFIGLGNLNALPGYILKLLGITKKAVYYVIDYVPKRFEDKLLNAFYHLIEEICADKCDATWNLSPRMIEAREKKWRRKFPNQIVAPHGVHFKRIKRLDFKNTKIREIVYMGSLLKKQGVQLVIESLPGIIKQLAGVKLVIIGKGPYENKLKSLVKKLKLQKHVEFLGYIQSHEEMENRITKAAVAVALYNRRLDPYDFTYYADPGKVKNYLGAGVPVLITDVPFVARQIKDAKCGFVVGYNREDITKNLVKYFSDKKLIKIYRLNAIRFAKKYEWSIVFSKAFSAIQ